MKLTEVPRLRLGTFPTPLQEAPRLSAALGLRVLIKRDDLTGLGLGGNKVRKLEYLVAEALAQGADVLVTGGGPQSNHTTLTALAARRAGISAHLVSYGDRRPGSAQGNGILNDLTAAEVTYTGDDDRASVDPALEATAEKLRAEGHTPYVIPRGGATALGCTGYVRASLELAGQLAEQGLSPNAPGGGHGLVRNAGRPRRRRPVAPGAVPRAGRDGEPATGRVHRTRPPPGPGIGRAPGPRAGPAGGSDDGVEVLAGYLGPGYGKPSPEGRAAMEMMARTEGLLLDPTFTAKAMAALVDLAADLARGRWSSSTPAAPRPPS